MLRSVANVFPTEVIMKSKFFFIGRILQLLEVRHPASPLRETHLMPSLAANMLLSPPSWASGLKGLRRFSGALHLGILV